jgi:hypothetical protein
MPQLVTCYFSLSFGFCKVAALRAAGAGADGGSGKWETEPHLRGLRCIRPDGARGAVLAGLSAKFASYRVSLLRGCSGLVVLAGCFSAGYVTADAVTRLL